MLPKSLVAAAPAVATKASVKWLPTLVLMPIATLAAVALTLVALVRGLMAKNGTTQQRDDAAMAREEIRSWRQDHRLSTVIVPMAFVVAFVFAPAAAVTLVLLVAALVMLMLWQRLAAAGLATRAELGSMAGQWLETLAVQSLMLAPLLAAHSPLAFHLAGSTPQMGVSLLAPLLLLGALACHAIARSGKPYAARLAWWCVTILMVSSLQRAPDSLVGEPVRSSDGWATAATTSFAEPSFVDIAEMVANLRAGGLPAPTIDELAPFYREVNPTAFSYTCHALLDLGLASPDVEQNWRAAFAGSPANPDRLARPDLVNSPAELLRYRLHQRQGLLLPLERDRIVAAVLDAHRTPNEHDSLGRLLAVAATLRELGADPMALRDRVHELLRATATNPEPTQGVGFLDYRRQAGTRVVADACNPVHSARAVLLMAQFGALSDLDVAAFDLHLQRRCAPQNAPVQFGNYAAFAALQAWRAQPGHVPFEPTWLDCAARWQVLCAVVLLVGFAVAATVCSRPSA